MITAGCGLLGSSGDPAETCSDPSNLAYLLSASRDPEFTRPEFAKTWAEAKERIGVNGLSKILVEKFDPQTKRVECSASVNMAGIPEVAGISVEAARAILEANLGDSQGVKVGSDGEKLGVRVYYHIAPLADGSGALISFDDPPAMGKLILHLALLLDGPLEKHDLSETADNAAEDLQEPPERLPSASQSADEPPQADATDVVAE